MYILNYINNKCHNICIICIFNYKYVKYKHEQLEKQFGKKMVLQM